MPVLVDQALPCRSRSEHGDWWHICQAWKRWHLSSLVWRTDRQLHHGPDSLVPTRPSFGCVGWCHWVGVESYQSTHSISRSRHHTISLSNQQLQYERVCDPPLQECPGVDFSIPATIGPLFTYMHQICPDFPWQLDNEPGFNNNNFSIVSCICFSDTFIAYNGIRGMCSCVTHGFALLMRNWERVLRGISRQMDCRPWLMCWSYWWVYDIACRWTWMACRWISYGACEAMGFCTISNTWATNSLHIITYSWWYVSSLSQKLTVDKALTTSLGLSNLFTDDRLICWCRKMWRGPTTTSAHSALFVTVLVIALWAEIAAVLKRILVLHVF